MNFVNIQALQFLCIFLSIHTTFAVIEGRLPNPGGSELLPETKEFIEKLEKATSVEDIKKLQEEDDTFLVHDFSDDLRKDSVHLKKTDSSSSSCKSTAIDTAKTPSSQGDNKSGQTKHDMALGDSATGQTHSQSHQAVPESSNNSNSNSANLQRNTISSGDTPSEDNVINQETVEPKANSTESNIENRTAEVDDEVFELVDFSKSNGPTERSEAARSGYESVRHGNGTLAGSVERQMRDPAPEQPPAGDPKKKKKKVAEQPPPTKEELEASYKYEVLAPPDNSPVKLDFPANPQAQGEEHLSQHVPLTLYCDTCMAIAFQVHQSFAKFHRQVTRRPPTESEIYHLVGEACKPHRYHEYGMLEVHGHRHISGPGCNELEAEGGVKHSRGPWPRRLADRCEEVAEDIGELTLHQAWLRHQRDPERFKRFMCFGDPPRNYCQKYGHMDAAAEAAARRDSRPPPETETPLETAGRLAREAEQAERRRLAGDEL